VLFTKYHISLGFSGLRDAAMATNVSISGRERHDAAIAYSLFGGCRELRRPMVCSGCRSVF
jgi:hypothetical protein